MSAGPCLIRLAAARLARQAHEAVYGEDIGLRGVKTGRAAGSLILVSLRIG